MAQHRGRQPDAGTPEGASYLEPYRRAVVTHGASFEATLWSSRRWQLERFAALLSMQDLADRVVVDAGAGQGDLALYLQSRGIKCRRYIALEAMPEQVEAARVGAPSWAEFHVADFVADDDALARFARSESDRPDVVVFSGSLNTLEMTRAQRVLAKAFDACGEAIVFNFLSARVTGSHRGDDTGPAKRFDPLAMLEWALTKTSYVAMRHDYLPDGHDATIAMRKRPAFESSEDESAS